MYGQLLYKLAHYTSDSVCWSYTKQVDILACYRPENPFDHWTFNSHPSNYFDSQRYHDIILENVKPVTTFDLTTLRNKGFIYKKKENLK